MVPTLAATHPHHERAIAALDRHLTAGDRMVILAHTLLETYSSLTRMPLPNRMAPDIAWIAIRDTFLTKGTVVSLRVEDYERLIPNLVAAGVVGGQVYDAAIVACARVAGVEVLVTFNEHHFRRFEGDGLTIEVP
jgi:toxin FitB